MRRMPAFALKKSVAAVAFAAAELRPARVAVIDNPMAVEVDENDFRTVVVGATIADLAPVTSHPVVCSIDGQYISRAQWNLRVRPGAIVVFQVVPLGGGGSNPLRMILQLALVIGVAMLVGPAGLGLTGMTAQLASAGFMLLGSLLINALVPLPKSNSGDSAAVSPTYSVALQGNSARLDSPIPVLYGRNRTYPDFAMQPYSSFIGNEQIYHAVLCVGKGRHEIMKLQIEDTDLSNFGDVQKLIIGPGSVGGIGAQTLINTSMVTSLEVAGQDLTSATEWTGPFTLVKAGKQCDRLYIDMIAPRGLGHAEDGGDISPLTIGWDIEARQINDLDDPIGGFVAMTDVNGYSYNMTAGAGETQQRSCEYIFPTPGRYEVRAKRSAARSDNNRDLNDLSWAGMRATLTTPGIYETVDPKSTYIFLRIRASKQLSGSSQRKIAVVSERKLPLIDGSWSHDSPTHRNPALVLLDILRNSDYSIGLKNSRIDLDSIQRLFDICDARQDRFDYCFDTRTTVWEALALVSRAARAVPIVRRGIYSFVRDSAQTLPAASYSPQRNIEENSLTMDIALPPENPIDAVRLKFRDCKTWSEKVVIAQYYDRAVYAYTEGLRPEGVPEPEKYADVPFPGIGGRNHALREAAYIVATSRWRRETVSFTTDLEGMLPAFGSLVAVSHDLPGWGQSADVLTWDESTLTLRACQDLAWTDGATHYVRVSTRRGGLTDAIAVTRGNSDDEMVLASSHGVSVIEYDDADLEPSRLMFGPADDVCQLVRVKSITPADEGKVKLLTVVEDAQVHLADNAFLPQGGAAQDVYLYGSIQNAVLPASGILM